jgi:hypothetical protein
VRGLDVLHPVVNNRVADGRRALRQRQHEADAGAIEEREPRRRAEEQWKSQGIAVEGDGPVEITDRDGDLVDAAQTDST